MLLEEVPVNRKFAGGSVLGEANNREPLRGVVGFHHLDTFIYCCRAELTAELQVSLD